MSFHSTGGGTWAMAGCYDDVQDLLTSVNDPDKHIRIVMWRSSGCYVCECRVPLLEGVRIGEARHMYSWGNPNEDNPDENVCHTSSGDVCHVWGGVPTITRRLLLEPRRARDACGSAAGCHKPIWRW